MNDRRTRLLVVAALAAALMLPHAAPAAADRAALMPAPGGGSDDAPLAPPPPRPLPEGVPAATRRPEPALPRPEGWPFAEAFSRTSGTGRYFDGAYFWTDFLYDDNGAISGPGLGESAGAWTFGTYEYPEENQGGNGADIFGAAIAADSKATWWRVDWNTLINPGVPAAAFALDTDESGGGAVAWGGNVGLTAAGVDKTLVITAKGAFLDGKRVAATRVDRRARSFVARIPRSKLDASKDWVAYLAAGLANPAGDAFLSLGPEHRHLPGQPNVFNVAFRDYGDEPADKNFWFDLTQATTLTQPNANVTGFGRTIEWGRLRRHVKQSQPLVRGWSNRWYVSHIELGQGRVAEPQSTVDNEPNYLGRVQPYAVYLPRAYRKETPARLTWLLHSLTINHNQFAATMPALVDSVCEKRASICATPLGRGPDGYYREVAELDFWEVWRTLWRTYSIDPQRVLIGGYSMGGFGTYNFALDHPDLFAGMFILAAAANEDVPRLENAMWTPYYHAHGVFDQLVPYPFEAQPTIDELDRLGYRYRFDTYPTKDHIVWSLEDSFDLAAEWIAAADRRRPVDPPLIRYRWFPGEVSSALGTGPTGAWWVRNIAARDRDAAEARIEARSYAKALWPITRARSTTPMVDGHGAPVVRKELAWTRADVVDYAPRVTLHLSNVGALSVELRRAGLPLKPGSVVSVTTDGRTSLRLVGFPASMAPTVGGRRVSGSTVVLAKGTHSITFARRSR